MNDDGRLTGNSRCGPLYLRRLVVMQKCLFGLLLRLASFEINLICFQV